MFGKERQMSMKDKVMNKGRGFGLQFKIFAVLAAFGIIPMLGAFGLTMMAGNVSDTLFIEQMIELAVVGAIVVGLGYYFGRSFSGRLNRLADVVDKLSQGDTDVTLDGQSGDEVGRIWDAVSDLRAAVAESGRVKQMLESLPINVMTADLTSVAGQGRRSDRDLHRRLP
jgi:methyl-accepting chemotaxis protein